MYKKISMYNARVTVQQQIILMRVLHALYIETFYYDECKKKKKEGIN